MTSATEISRKVTFKRPGPLNTSSTSLLISIHPPPPSYRPALQNTCNRKRRGFSAFRVQQGHTALRWDGRQTFARLELGDGATLRSNGRPFSAWKNVTRGQGDSGKNRLNSDRRFGCLGVKAGTAQRGAAVLIECD